MVLLNKNKKKNSSAVANQRLQTVLTYDRSRNAQVSELLEQLKRDILEVITEYLEIDAEQLSASISPSRSDTDTATAELSLSVPIRQVKTLPRSHS